MKLKIINGTTNYLVYKQKLIINKYKINNLEIIKKKYLYIYI